MLTRRLSEKMDPKLFIRSLKLALKDPEIKNDFGSIVADQLQILRMELKEKDETIRKLTSRVASLESQLEGQEQYSRRNCITISGLKEQPEETIINKTLDLFNTRMALQPQISPEDIDRTHRIGKMDVNRGPRQVIVKFTSYRARERVVSARTTLRSSTVQLQDALFINEALTPQSSKILYQLRKMKKDGEIKNVWTNDGTFVVIDNHNNKKSAKTLIEADKLIKTLKPS